MAFHISSAPRPRPSLAARQNASETGERRRSSVAPTASSPNPSHSRTPRSASQARTLAPPLATNTRSRRRRSHSIAATEDDAKVDGFCAKCDRYKPSKAYHCSKCKRCVSRMDHHCPYTNNCVGAKNQKHMVLFLIYSNLQAVYALALVAYYGGYRGYLYDEGWLALALTALLGVDGGMTLLFTGTMCRRQVISMQTGIGTIHRLKLAKGKPIAGGTPIPLSSIFGHTVLFWPLPLDPDFPPDVDAEILGFRCPRVADEHREPLWRPVSQETGLLSGEERKEPA